MTFFDGLKGKYALVTDGEESSLMDQKKLVEKNIIQEDNIIMADGRVLNIFMKEVTIEDILEYFKDRLPGLQLVLHGREAIKSSEDLLELKYVVYNQLIAYVTETSKYMYGKCLGEKEDPLTRLKEQTEDTGKASWRIDGNTIH